MHIQGWELKKLDQQKLKIILGSIDEDQISINKENFLRSLCISVMPNEEKIKEACRKLKPNKVPGPGGIPSEIIKILVLEIPKHP